MPEQTKTRLTPEQEKTIQKIAEQIRTGELTLPFDKTIITPEEESQIRQDIHERTINTTDEDWE